MSKKVILICEMCFSRNYTFSKSEKISSTRLEIKKFCPKCNTHTLHQETK